MKLYTVPLAPNPTRVTLYLAERRAQGVDIPVEPVVVNTLKGRHREPEHLARNSFGTLPVLEFQSDLLAIGSRYFLKAENRSNPLPLN